MVHMRSHNNHSGLGGSVGGGGGNRSDWPPNPHNYCIAAAPGFISTFHSWQIRLHLIENQLLSSAVPARYKNYISLRWNSFFFFLTQLLNNAPAVPRSPLSPEVINFVFFSAFWMSDKTADIPVHLGKALDSFLLVWLSGLLALLSQSRGPQARRVSPSLLQENRFRNISHK